MHVAEVTRAASGRAPCEIVADYGGGSLKIYGALRLAPGAGLAKLESVGLYIDDAALTLQLNFTGENQTVNLPDPANPHDPSLATPFDIAGTAFVDISITGLTLGTFAKMHFEVAGNTVFNMEGGFDLSINADGLQMFASINSLTVGPSDTPFVTFQGYGLFIINNQGIAAAMALNLSAGTTATFSSGFELNATFTLVMNTTANDVLYDIPATLPPVTVPGTTTTVTTLTIPRGPPMGLIQADGTFVSYGAAGPYIVITGNGTLGITLGSLDALSFQGFFRFELSASSSGPVVSLIIGMRGDVLGFADISITGALQIDRAGVVALLDMGVAAGSETDYGSGVILTATFQLAINSTSAGVSSIGGIDLTDNTGAAITIPASTYQLFGSGTLALGIGGTGFVITGSIFASVSGTTTTITISGKLTATIAGAELLNMNAAGVIVVETAGANWGIAGQLTLTVTYGNPFSGTGFGFTGTFDLQLNTTLVAQTVTVGTGTTTIAAGPNGSSTGAAYVQVYASGLLYFGTTDNNFSLDGDFYFAIGSEGLAVSARASLGITLFGVSLFSVDGSAALLIASDGIAATLTASVNFNGPSSNGSSFGFSMGGTFTLSVNTTGRSVTIGSVTISGAAAGMSAGPYFQIGVPDAHVIVGNASNGFDLGCSLVLTVGSQGLAMSGSGSLNLKVGGLSLFSFSAIGGLLINGDGIAAKMALTIGSGQSGNSFVFGASVSFALEINTTSTAVTTINNVTVNLAAGPYFKVSASGRLTIASIVNINGSFTFEIGAGGVELTLDASANIFGVVFRLNGAAGIYSDGIVINLALSISGGGTSASFLSGLITIDAQFVLKINSTGSARLGVDANQQFVLSVHGTSGSGDASVYIFGFRMTGQLDIKIVSGNFDAAGHLNFNFFGFATLDVAFHFNSNGKYTFTGSIYVQLGSSAFNIHGTLSLRFSNEAPPNFELRVDGGVTAFGFNFASVGAAVQINGTSVDIAVYVSVDFYFFSIGGTVRIHLGSLANVPTPPPPVIAQVLAGGVLQLNMGTDAVNRGVEALTDENYDISLISTNADGSVNLSVFAPGVYGQAITYNNVTSILLNNTGTSNTTIQIAGNVLIPVNITAGSGKNQFIMGGGHATITGTTGNDKVIGGAGGVTFHAGTGASSFIGGRGNNVVYDPALVTIIQGYETVDNDGNHHYFYFNTYSLTDAASGSGYTYTLTYGDAGGTYTTNLVGTNFTVTLTTPSAGTASFVVSNFSGNVTLKGNGNPNATATVTLDASLVLDGSIITESNGGIITLEDIPTLRMYGGSSANTFTINSWSGTSPLLLDGREAGDTYKVNFVGSGTYTVNVNDSGAAGVDSLSVNGTAGTDTLNLNSNSITRATETVNFSGVENITLNTFAGTDTVNVNNPTAAIVVNGGSGNDTYNINAITNPLTINTGTGTNTLNVPAMNSIQALLTLNGGGTETLNLDDTADGSPNSGTLGASSLTGFFGAGGSMNYSGIETMNLNLGSGGNTLTISGRSGVTNVSTGAGADTINVLALGGTTNINAGARPNTFNVGSLVFNNGTGMLGRVQGTINYTGSGTDTMNVDDSGGSAPETGTLRPGSLKFFDPLTINYTGVTVLNIALGQGADIFAVVDTFTSSSTSPVIVIDGNAGDDTITILDTHAVMTVNGGDGNDGMYVFGNSSVLNLNGNDGDDTFYIYASLHENTSNLDPGDSSPAGNTIYSYRVNAAVNIDGGSGHDRVFIFGTVLNDIITINGTHVTGAGLNVSFTNIEELIVVGLGGDDTFYVLSIAVPTTLIGDGTLVPNPPIPPDVTLPDLTGGAVATSFNDTFYIGWQGQSYIPGRLLTIQAPLTIQGNEGADTAYVDDSGATANTSHTLDATSFVSSSMGPEGIIYYDNTVDDLNIKAGAGHDTITINGNATGSQTTIYGGPGNDHFIVNDDPLLAPLALVGDSNTFWGDTLTINGAPEGNDFVVTGFTVDGAGATISYATIELLTINALGASNFTVNGDIIPTYLNGSVDNDTFTINSSSTPLFLDGGAGADTFTINGNSGPLTATGGAGNDTFTINGNAGSLALSGGDDNDTFIINGGSGSLVVMNGNAGNDNFTLNALSSPVTLNGGAGDDSFTVNAPLAASPTILGGGGSADTLTVNGTVGNDFWVITNSGVGGVGAQTNYSDLDSLIINGISGNDTFNVRSTSASTTLNTGTGLNTINVGSLAPIPGGIVDGVQGALTIVGNGNDILNVDDAASVIGKTGSLTPTTLTGLGMGAGGITFTGIAMLNISLGSGNDTFVIVNTPSVPTNINGNAGDDTFNVWATTGVTSLTGGAGNDTFNLGSLMPVLGGSVNSIAGQLNINGGSNAPVPLPSIGGSGDVMNVDDSGDVAPNTGRLTATSLDGLGLGSAVNYTGVESLNVNLGSGSDWFFVGGTNETTVTTLNTGGGTNSIYVGSVSPLPGGVLSSIHGPLNIIGSGTDCLIVDDSGITVTNTGTLTPTTLTGFGMIPGGITFSGLATMNIYLGSASDTIYINNMTDSIVTTIDSDGGADTAWLNFSGNFGSNNLTFLGFGLIQMSVANNFTGLLNATSAFLIGTIGGSFTSDGMLNVGSVDSLAITGDFAGLLNVTGLLNTLAVGGGSPGRIAAGNIYIITVASGFGNQVLQVIEGGVERQIQAVPVAGGMLADTLRFAFIYDSTTPGDPQLAIRITNSGTVTPHSFDLALVCFRSNAKFNLALVFAAGQTGISNVAVSGDILANLTAAELNFFGLPAGSRSGVNLPLDNITGVEVSGSLPIGMVNVAGIEGVAFAVLTTATGRVVNILGDLGSTGNPQVLWNLLGSKAAILAATDVFRVPFNETHGVRLYAQANTNLNLECVMTLTDQNADNAPVTAYVQLQPAFTSTARPNVNSLRLLGDGSSINSIFSVASITSTGSLGDVTVRGAAGLGSITAASIFGNLNVTTGGITGTIQTTGIRIDPITGAQTVVSADLGRTLYSGSKITGVTLIFARLAITGQIISRGNLVSTVKTSGSFSGVIAAQGDIGAILRIASGAAVTNTSGQLTRYGGISIAGSNSGQIIALGNLFCDVTMNGSLTGRIAAHGQTVSGLAASRIGILGNVTIRSAFAAGAAVVSGGLIGDATGKTVFSSGTATGFLAADGGINPARSLRIPATNLLPNSQFSANGAVLDAIFTNNSQTLAFDSGGSLQGLTLIESDLNRIQITGGSLTGTTP